VILDDTDGSFSGDAREHTTTAADSCAPPRGDCDRERLSSSSERGRAELCQASGGEVECSKSCVAKDEAEGRLL
jgi:hypothetical protein